MQERKTYLKGRPILKVKGLCAGYFNHPVLKDISFDLKQGEWLGVIGPNGAGKTTLLKSLCRVIVPEAGSVWYLGREIRDWPTRELARHIAILSAEDTMRFPFTVREVVMMGRSPYWSRFGWESRDDQRIVDKSLALSDTTELQDKTFFDLSSGEKRRVMISQALAQEPQLLFLDEPNAFLDLKHQVQLFSLLKQLHQTQKLTLLMTLHDLNLAAEFCSRLILLKQGEIVTAGRPQDVLTMANLRQVYGVQAKVWKNPVTRTPWIFPVSVVK